MATEKQVQRQKKSLIIIGLALAGIVIFAVIGAIFSAIFPEEEARDPENVASDISNENGEKEREKWPIIANLPIENALFTLGYQIEGENLTIFVDTTETYLEEALEKLASLDTSGDISAYNIVIRSPESPFTGTFVPNDESDPISFLEAGYSALEVPLSAFSTTEKGDLTYVSFTTGSEETYNLIHYTAILKQENDSWTLVKEPTPSLLVQPQ